MCRRSINKEAEKFYYEGLKHFNNREYEKAIGLNPKYANAYNDKGLALNNLGRYDESIPYFDKAIEINPKHGYIYYNKGNAYNALGKYDESIEDFDEAIKLNSNLAEAYNNRGNAYVGKKEYDNAIKNFDKAIEINPNLSEARRNIVIFNNMIKQKKSTFTGFKDCNNMINCAVESNGGNVIGLDGCDNVDGFKMKVKSNSGSNITVAKDSSNLENIESEIEINSNNDLFNEIERLAQTLKDNTEILNSIVEMRDNLNTPSFEKKYTDFISLIADHVAIFLPVLVALAKLL